MGWRGLPVRAPHAVLLATGLLLWTNGCSLHYDLDGLSEGAPDVSVDGYDATLPQDGGASDTFPPTDVAADSTTFVDVSQDVDEAEDAGTVGPLTTLVFRSAVAESNPNQHGAPVFAGDFAFVPGHSAEVWRYRRDERTGTLSGFFQIRERSEGTYNKLFAKDGVIYALRSRRVDGPLIDLFDATEAIWRAPTGHFYPMSPIAAEPGGAREMVYGAEGQAYLASFVSSAIGGYEPEASVYALGEESTSSPDLASIPNMPRARPSIAMMGEELVYAFANTRGELYVGGGVPSAMGSPLHVAGVTGAWYDTDIAACGDSVAVATGQTLLLYDHTLTEVDRRTLEGEVLQLAFSPDCNSLAIVGRAAVDGAMEGRLWTVALTSGALSLHQTFTREGDDPALSFGSGSERFVLQDLSTAGTFVYAAQGRPVRDTPAIVVFEWIADGI